MTNFKHIYAHQAEDYERLVAREDYQGNILKALEEIRPFPNQTIVEFGAGTGRVTNLLLPLVKQIYAFDQSSAMLKVAEQKLQQTPYSQWHLATANNDRIPLPNDCADIAVEGWSFGHLRGWYPDQWQQKLDEAIAEMKRLLHSDGTMILLETLGTGHETPYRFPELNDLFSYIEKEHQFNHSWIRTDYKFTSLEEAVTLTDFFFGKELAAKIKTNNWVILPECTGIWWK